MTGKALHTRCFRRTCCYGNAGCAAALEARRRACEVTGVQQLLRRVVWPQRMHACSVAGARGPPTLHTGPAFHKSTSSSPTRGGSGPRRLSSLLCFLLTKQKTNVKGSQGRAVPVQPGTSICRFPAACKVIYLTSSLRFSPPLFLAYIQYSKESLYAL